MSQSLGKSQAQGKSLIQRIWEIQEFWRDIARELVFVIAGHNLQMFFAEVAIGLWSVCMVIYPVSIFIDAATRGTVFISFPQILMCIAGLYGLRFSLSR